jgi:hypothetical protein
MPVRAYVLGPIANKKNALTQNFDFEMVNLKY